jgi:DNA polymerase-4
MRAVWGSIWGKKLWYLLRGMEQPDEITARRSIGHSHVMAPELRDPVKAKDVARRLTLKTASRLRRMEYYAGAMSFSARLENDTRVHAEERFYRAQDNKTFLDLLNKLWTQPLTRSRGVRIRKVSVTLSDLRQRTCNRICSPTCRTSMWRREVNQKNCPAPSTRSITASGATASSSA